MPHNPGDPENTDPEATSADRAEAAAEKAEEAQAANDAQADASEEAKLDPTLDADLEDALADVNADEVEAEAEGDEPTSTGAATNDVEAQLAERTEDLQRLNAEYTNYRRRTERDRQGQGHRQGKHHQDPGRLWPFPGRDRPHGQGCRAAR